jgi:dihydroorotase-like cyclic amidohydrolase
VGAVSVFGGQLSLLAVIEMPQTIPIVIDRARFLQQLVIARSKAVVDFGLRGALTAENVSPDGSPGLREMADEGAMAFKGFTSDSQEQARIPEQRLGKASASRFGTPKERTCCRRPANCSTSSDRG